MKTFLALVFVTSISLACAQTKCSYDRNGEVTSASDAYYFVYADSVEEKKHSAYYTTNGNVRFVETRVDEKETHRVYYYPSGALMAEARMLYSNTIGVLNVYYPDGKPQAEIEFPDGPRKYGEELAIKINSYWNNQGNKLVDNGRGDVSMTFPELCGLIDPGEGSVINGYKDGIWKGTLCDGSMYEERYAQGLVLSGEYRQRGMTYHYTQLENRAIPKEGIQRYYQFVGATIRYPKKARKSLVQGKVFVAFVVNEDGTISNVKTEIGISPECDQEAERVIALSPPWSPGLYRGKPVKQKMILPITFKL